MNAVIQAAPATILFAPLAMNQTRFFKAVGDRLEEHGYRTAYVCFHECSHEWLVARTARSYNAFALQPKDPDSVDLERYKVPHVNLLLEHEKAAYEVYDTQRLLRKFKGHLHAMSAVLDDLERQAPCSIHLVQELGGFLSALAAYYAARARGIDNWFIEPSFFRGRVFFTRNSLSAPPVAGTGTSQVSPEVKEYLDRIVRQQEVVIPKKDSHHYRGVTAKLTDSRNVWRLLEKMRDKYLLGKREEFEHVGGHVRRHVRMFVNSLRLRRYYRPLAQVSPFVYYPLHVPADFALTIRSPEYLDQYSLIDFICRTVPHSHKVAIKEHPALVGAMSLSRMTDLLRRHDNLILLDPRINNYEVLRLADAVITVNSKSGAEALLLGKQVLVLGDAFYRSCHQARAVERLEDLPQSVNHVLDQHEPHQREAIYPYFQQVWNCSHPGELYDMTEENIHVFAASLVSVLKRGFHTAEEHEAFDDPMQTH